MEKVEAIHKEILQTAAEIANADDRTPITGHPFREASGRSRLGGLCLDFDEGLLDMIHDAHERVRVSLLMRLIGQESIRRAVLLHSDKLASLIVGDAHYLDRFKTDNGAQPI